MLRKFPHFIISRYPRSVQLLTSLFFKLQTKADIAQMEPVQGHPAAVEGENPAQQRHMEMLAHAM